MINFKNIILFSFITSITCCKAQTQTLPLNTGVLDIPQNAYVKDLNNELTPYVGTYKASFQGKEITLYITKEENKLVKRANQQFYRDALVVKYIVKNSAGTTLQDTKNNNLPKIYIYSTKMKSQNSVVFIYSGTNCRVGWGDIYLTKVNSTQISWEYRPDDIILENSKCPPGTDINIYLPETKDLIFTKQ
ncbi:hypothetical protein SAMN05421664_3396 [Chryseobacterium soldanellicola]|uniref:DUF6705 domain-containing protein n=1 Tax=Chryseobacterium soldanellicola TaxID=311333 RepID=A0A1H1G1J6_9FLAO|nr:DUF6705 family protein [Chryseobacterium soldanellicola]SDR07094.1 hypothetical protein SAMN05421664_3396 [Chryseobacterium soldanellicola]